MKLSTKHIFLLASLLLNIDVNSQNILKKEEISDLTQSFGKTNYYSSDSIINYGKLFLNTPYQYGATGESSFDCSGFTSYVYNNFGVKLERSSTNQSEQFPIVERNNLKAGDLVFFEGSRHNNRVGHVGIVVQSYENGQFDFIHASVHDGVTISNSDASYYSTRFIKAARVLSTEDSQIKNIKEIFNKYKEGIKIVRVKQKTTPAVYHRVKSGETLSELSEKYNTSVTELKRMNKLKSNNIKIHQNLKIKNKQNLKFEEELIAENKRLSKSDSTAYFQKIKKQTTALNNQKNTKKELFKKATNEQTLNELEKKSLSQLSTINSSENYISEPIITITPQEITVNNSISNTFSQNNPIIHTVIKGETLFGISKSYNTTLLKLKSNNKIINNTIHEGQILVISTSNDSSAPLNSTPKTLTHKVLKGQSMYSISQLYGCSIENLKDWNKKKSTILKTGEKLIIKDKIL